MRTKSGSKNKSLSVFVGFLIAAMLLLANPVWELTDLLPDVLAWVFIWFALRNFSEQNENMFRARRYALYLIAIEALKLAVWPSVMNSDIRSDGMLATLAFGICEVGCGILFFRAFLNGTEEYAREADCESLYLKIEDTRFLCFLFLIVRAACTLLPELTAIPDWYVQYAEVADDELYNTLSGIAAAEDFLTVVCSALSLVVAVVWLVSVIPFLRRFSRDTAMSGYLSGVLFAENPERQLKRRFSMLHMARLFFAVGMLFALDATVDEIRILPLCVFPLCVAVGCIFMERFARGVSFRKPIALGFVSFAVFLLAEIYRRYFTVWDLRVYAELEPGTEMLSALWMLVGMTCLFALWLWFAHSVEETSAALGCGEVGLSGMPYLLLALYGLVQTVIYTLPVVAGTFNFLRIALVAAFWMVTSRRLAAFEESVQKELMLNTPG